MRRLNEEVVKRIPGLYIMRQQQKCISRKTDTILLACNNIKNRQAPPCNDPKALRESNLKIAFEERL